MSKVIPLTKPQRSMAMIRCINTSDTSPTEWLDNTTIGLANNSTYSWSIWFWLDHLTSDDGKIFTLWSGGNSGTTVHYSTLRVSGGGYLGLNTRASDQDTVSVLVKPRVGWNHAVGSWKGTNRRWCYLNGVRSLTDATTNLSFTFSSSRLARYTRAGDFTYPNYQGGIGPCTLYKDINLSDGDVMLLSGMGDPDKAVSPFAIRPTDIFRHYQWVAKPIGLNGNRYGDYRNRSAWTPNGSPDLRLLDIPRKTTYHVIPAEVPQPSTGVRVLTVPGHPTKIGGRARSFAATSTYLSSSISGLAFPFSIACWIKSDGAGSGNIVRHIGVGDSAGTHFAQVQLYQGDIYALDYDGSAQRQSIAAGSYNDEAWHLTGGIWRDNYRKAFVDATSSSGISTANLFDPANCNRITINQQANSSGGYGGSNTQIAYAALWSVELTDAEFSALYNGGIGLDPRLVRPANLVAYWPLTHNDKNYAYTGSQYDLTPVNNPTWAPGPLIQSRSKTTYHVIPEQVTPSTGVRVIPVQKQLAYSAIDTGNPLNKDAFFNQGLRAWYADLPGYSLHNKPSIVPAIYGTPAIAKEPGSIKRAMIRQLPGFQLTDNLGRFEADRYITNVVCSYITGFSAASFWVKTNGADITRRFPFGHTRTSYSAFYAYNYSSNSDPLEWRVIAAPYQGSSQRKETYFRIPSVGEWHHVLIYWERLTSRRITVYVNGTKADYSSPYQYWGGSFRNNGYPFGIGARYTSATAYENFDGAVSNFKLWDYASHLVGNEHALYQEELAGYPTMLNRRTQYVTIPAAPPTDYTPRFPDIFQSPIIGGL